MERANMFTTEFIFSFIPNLKNIKYANWFEKKRILKRISLGKIFKIEIK